MCRPKGNGFCAFSVWKQEYWHFAHFGLESGTVFEGNIEVYSEVCEFEMDFKKSLCLRFNLSNHDIFLPRGQVWNVYGF